MDFQLYWKDWLVQWPRLCSSSAQSSQATSSHLQATTEKPWGNAIIHFGKCKSITQTARSVKIHLNETLDIHVHGEPTLGSWMRKSLKRRVNCLQLFTYPGKIIHFDPKQWNKCGWSVFSSWGVLFHSAEWSGVFFLRLMGFVSAVNHFSDSLWKPEHFF